jgi:hypothetical protein
MIFRCFSLAKLERVADVWQRQGRKFTVELIHMFYPDTGKWVPFFQMREFVR